MQPSFTKESWLQRSKHDEEERDEEEQIEVLKIKAVRHLIYASG